MKIPAASEKAWTELIEGKIKPHFKFLATSILVRRLVFNYSCNPDPGTMKVCVDELIEFFTKNGQIPQAQEDLKNIFGGTNL